MNTDTSFPCFNNFLIFVCNNIIQLYFLCMPSWKHRSHQIENEDKHKATAMYKIILYYFVHCSCFVLLQCTK